MEMRHYRLRAEHHNPRTIRCGISDLLLQDHAPPLVFFFEHAVDHEPLRDALGQVLSDFPLFAGTLRQRRDRLEIDCDNQGVPFRVVHHSHDADSVLRHLFTAPRGELLDLVDPAASIRRGEPVFAVRLNYYRCGRMSLGICWHHALGDLQTVLLLMRAWTAVVAGQGYDKPLIVEDRDQYLRANVHEPDDAASGLRFLGPLDLVRLLLYQAWRGRDRVPVVFYFTPDELLRMKQALTSGGSAWLSSNDVIVGHMVSLISQHDPERRSRDVAITVNFRKQAGLADTLLGNIVTSLNVRCDPDTPPARLARAVRQGVDDYAAHHMNYLTNLRFMEQHGGLVRPRRFLSRGLDPIKGNLLVTNWSRFGAYDLSFGAGTPTLVTHVGEAPIPWISAIIEGFHGQGRMFMVLLPSAIAAALTSEVGQRAVHAHRDRHDAPPEMARSTPWIL